LVTIARLGFDLKLFGFNALDGDVFVVEWDVDCFVFGRYDYRLTFGGCDDKYWVKFG